MLKCVAPYQSRYNGTITLVFNPGDSLDKQPEAIRLFVQRDAPGCFEEVEEVLQPLPAVAPIEKAVETPPKNKAIRRPRRSK